MANKNMNFKVNLLPGEQEVNLGSNNQLWEKIYGNKIIVGEDSYGIELPYNGEQGQIFYTLAPDPITLDDVVTIQDNQNIIGYKTFQDQIIIDGESNPTLCLRSHDNSDGYNGHELSLLNINGKRGILDDTHWMLATTNGEDAITDMRIFGAVWNDYAEYRQSNDTIEAGRVVVENGNDTVSLSSKRLQAAANIVSDTFGFAIGRTEECQTPIAVSGRVLAYPYEDREVFKKNIGRPVCSGPNGTVSIMTQDEYQKFGYKAIGTVSAVPDYEEWGNNKIQVNGRVWIKVI